MTLDLPATPSHPRQKPNSHRAASTPTDSAALAALDLEELGHLGTDSSEEREFEDRIQILDLHTKNPVISYRNQIFSCQWTSTIGTDLLLTPPESENSLPKLLEGDGFDILATTNIKIVGQPVDLVPRYDAVVSEPAEAPARAVPAQPETKNTNAEPAGEAPIRIPVGPESGRARQNQARFLERLMAAKSAKGDTDTIPLYPRKKVTGSGWRSWQQPEDGDGDGDADAAIEHQESGATNDEDDSEGESRYGQGSNERSIATTTPQQSQSPRGVRAGSRGVGRPRGGRRRPQIKARAMGGLFRDYRPNVGDENGADIRASIPDTTPRTWGVPAAAVGPVTMQTMEMMQTTGGTAGARAEAGDGNGNGNENGETGAEVRPGQVDTTMGDT